MAQRPVSRDEAQVILDAVTLHGSQSKAAMALKMPVSTLQNRLDAAKRMGLTATPAPVVDALQPSRAAATYEEAWRLWQSIIGQTVDHYEPPPERKRAGTEKIVVASDFHVPFHHGESVSELFRRESDADVCIVGGDLMDFYSVSRFMKYEKVDVLDELAATSLMIEQLASTFPKVVIIEGNHDRPRFEKALRSNLEHAPDVLHVIEWLVSFHATPSYQGPILSPIAAMASRYPNVRIAQSSVGNHRVGWFTQYGDALIAHTEKYSKVPGAVLRQVDEYFSDFEKVYGLSDWRVVFQAHTHAMGWFPWRADRLLVELGCLCKTHGYQLTPSAMGRPQRNGYATLVQENGKTLMSSVRPHWLDGDRERVA